MAQNQDASRQRLEEETMREILRAVRTIKYGTIQLSIHEGRVVQIDKTEKVRLQRDAPG